MSIIAILHDIRSEENVGSIFRTADAVGVEKIYLTGYTPAPLDEFKRKRNKIAKAALGAENSVEWEKKTIIQSVLKRLRAEGYTLVGIEQDIRSIPYTQVSYMRTDKVAYVVGNEVTGVPKAVLKHMHTLIEVPMRGKKESLNVGIAFGVALYGTLRD